MLSVRGQLVAAPRTNRGSPSPERTLTSFLFTDLADSTSSLLFIGSYTADRGWWPEYAATLDRARARAGYWRAEGNSGRADGQEIAARALEGHRLWKRGQKAEAIRVLEEEQRRLFGGEPHRGISSWYWPNLAILMLEVGRPRDAELEAFEDARASYEYALMSWQEADPESQPRIQKAQRSLERLPKSLRRERS